LLIYWQRLSIARYRIFAEACQGEEVTEVIVVVAVQEDRIEVKVKAGLISVPGRSKTEMVEFLDGSS
jgi:hypothetical protein